MMNTTEKRLFRSEKLREEYTFFRHKSGLRVYVFPKKLSASYALFATRYGSLENAFKTDSDAEFTRVPEGIAHFLEHKMFENEDGVDTFERFGKTGASANAYTSFDRTAYLFSATEKVYESLEILLNFVTHPYFTPETVAKEQGIIAQEIRMYEDRPSSRVYYELMRGLYEKNDVRTEIAGSVESISHITSDLLYKCYHTFYNLRNMVLCVCGDADADGVEAVLNRVLKDAPEQKVIRSYPEEKREAHEPYREIKMQVARPQFAIGVKDVPIADPIRMCKRDFGMSILMEILFGSSTPFYCDLYDKGILNGQFSFGFDTTDTFAYQYLSGETDDPKALLQTVKDYVFAAQKKPIDPDAFLRAKRTTYADFVRLFDSTEDIANELINYALFDMDIFEVVRILDEIDIPFVEGLLKNCYREEYFSLAVVLPEK